MLRYTLKLIYLFLFLLTSVFPALAREGYAPVRNFAMADYKGGGQNWGAVEDAIDRVYVANGYGMLCYDGSNWNLYQLPNYTTIRSLLADHRNGRIYAGGTSEFGFFSPDIKTGTLKYTSLSSSLHNLRPSLSEVWDIVECNGKILFRSDYHIFCYDGKRISTLTSAKRISKIANVGGQIYVAFGDGSLALLDGNKFRMLPGTECLHNKKISVVLPFNNSKLLIGTAFDGLFVYDGETTTPVSSPINDFLKGNQLFCGATNGKNYVFGTVQGGAVIYNFNSGETSYISKTSGLINNTVLAANYDSADNLWLSLDYGLAYVSCNTPMLNLTGSLNPIGAGYASLNLGNKLFLGTNQGLYTMPYPSGPSMTLPSFNQLLKGQIWSLTQIGGTIFASSDAGLYASNGGETFLPIAGLPGTACVRPMKGDPTKAFALSYDGFHLLKLNAGRWMDSGLIAGYNDIATDFILDESGDIWLAHWRKGVYHLHYNPQSNRFDSVVLYNRKNGLKDDQIASVSLYKGRVVISSTGGYYYYDYINESLAPYTKLNKIAGMTNGGALRELNDSTLAFVSNNGFSIARRDATGAYICDSMSFRKLGSKLIPGFIELRQLPDRKLILSGYDGFWSIDPNHQTRNRQLRCYVSSIMVEGDSLIYRKNLSQDSIKNTLTIPYRLNTLKLNFGCNEYTGADAILYDSFLEGYDHSWSGFKAARWREYTKLPPGKYILHLRARNIHSGEQCEYTLKLRVLPPWYRTTWAYTLWILIGVGIIILIYWRIDQKMVRTRRAIEQRKREEVEALEIKSRHDSMLQEMEIVKLKSEQLEQDIAHKGEQLSNTTTNLISKNELLQEISSHIKQLSESREASGKGVQKALIKIQDIINQSISSDSDWENFSRNFDVVYANFSTRLTERHPDLSITDKRLCCYLRMGLTSKEIAPLVNITVKSVEMARYRVRKKLGLGPNDSLSSYLHSL